MQSIIREYDVWISGLRRDQNAHRSNLRKEEHSDDGILRYYPILDRNSKDIREYKSAMNLPSHPLEAKGYSSIGCEPCTRSDFDGRGWKMVRAEKDRMWTSFEF